MTYFLNSEYAINHDVIKRIRNLLQCWFKYLPFFENDENMI